MKNIFVTGITGKSGMYLLEEIINADNDEFSFTFLVRNEAKAAEIKRRYPRANICLASLEDKDLIHDAMKGMEVLLHIAGIGSSEDLVREAVDCGIKRLILVHTTGIFSKYKAAGETYRRIESRIDAMIKGKDVAKTILRPTMIYGNLQDGNVSIFMKMVYKLRIFPVVNKARYELQPVWCGDLGKAYYQVLTHPETTMNKNYNLSGGRPILLIDMLKVMARKMGVTNRFVSVPFWLAYGGAWGLYLVSFGTKDFREKVQRLVEPRVYGHEEAAADFGYDPVNFEDGIDLEINEFMNVRNNPIKK